MILTVFVTVSFGFLPKKYLAIAVSYFNSSIPFTRSIPAKSSVHQDDVQSVKIGFVL